ncbi:hypothetical protein ACFVU4_22940 [Streptomyces sp. NPDC058107]|uniref:hypothetical protein n=1 Tax=Streptomyces sp. NPDC058107 TaxID=3346343 RepID=UPI0036E1E756
MNLLQNAITAMVTLLAVALGGVLSVRNSDRSWHRDHAQKWRDIRLEIYGEFLSAYRQYMICALDPNSQVLGMERANLPSDPIPIFDETGRPYKEKLDATLMSVRLVSERPETVIAVNQLARAVRRLAASRVNHGVDDLPGELFESTFRAQHDFVRAVRLELGLSEIPMGNGDLP